LLVAVLGAMAFGVVMVYSASVVRAAETLGDPEHFLSRSALNVTVALVALVAGMGLSLRWYHRGAYVVLGLAIALMALLLPFGRTVNNATRWFDLGFVRFQPTEFAKPALIIYLAYSLVKKSDRIRSFGLGFAPHLLVAGLLVLLSMKQPDFGTSVSMVVIMLAMLYVGGTKLKYLVGVGLAGVPVVALAIKSSPMRWNRLVSFLDPWGYCSSFGYHLCESLLAVGSGGLTGTGLGLGRQKLLFLPEAHNDFILAIITEELGLLGLGAILALFAFITWRGVRIARGARTPFARYLAFGITFQILFQAMINAGVVTGLLPTKGLTLPLVSYGGSSLVLTCWMLGLLLRISMRLPADDPAEEPAAAVKRSSSHPSLERIPTVSGWRSHGGGV